MKKVVSILLLLTLLYSVSQAQRKGRQHWKKYRYELVGGLGVSSFLGELGGRNAIGSHNPKDFNFTKTRTSLNIGLRYRIRERLAFKVGLSHAILTGSDETTKEHYRNHRNMKFYTHIIEFAGQLEYYFLKEKPVRRYRIRKRGGSNISAYAFVGVGGFWFNPQGKRPDNGKWVSLQPLGTEGQGVVPGRTKYKRTCVAIPYGLGMKYGLTRRWSIGLEFGARYTFTDYIDDVSTTYVSREILEKNSELSGIMGDPTGKYSGQTAPGLQRGNANHRDMYMFLMITANYKIKKQVRHRPKFSIVR